MFLYSFDVEKTIPSISFLEIDKKVFSSFLPTKPDTVVFRRVHRTKKQQESFVWWTFLIAFTRESTVDC